ncbi:MAG: hypothetical protein D3910_01720 [Candidatus Electrothrix sp. ATG2]|nr:hypothetical protein [Candidatus Electrothrix sp. ATG2]
MRKLVAVVIPVWKENLSGFEEISLRQSSSILNKHTFYLISYRGLNIKKITDILEEKSVRYKLVFFKKKSFSSIADYSRLMLSVGFYGRFIKYKYILLYQLDCFVFRDELESWADAGYSYIGAPWLKGYGEAKPDAPVIGVGNGGLSLRNVADHLNVLFSFSFIEKPRHFFGMYANNLLIKALKSFLFCISNATVQNNTFFLFNNWSSNEDIFWAEIATRNFSWFKVPEYQIASRFSTEVQPRYFYELHRKETPFGCHAWWTYDFEFWKPHIEKFGYNLITHVDG